MLNDLFYYFSLYIFAIKIGCGSFVVFLTAAAFFKCDAAGAVTCVILGIGFNGCIYSGYYISILDVCGPFAGSVMGVMNMTGTTVGIFGPYVVGVLTDVQVGMTLATSSYN